MGTAFLVGSLTFNLQYVRLSDTGRSRQFSLRLSAPNVSQMLNLNCQLRLNRVPPMMFDILTDLFL